MQYLTNYLCNKLIDQTFRGQSYAFPTTLEFGLFVTQPGKDGSGTEVSGPGYARVPIACSLTEFSGTQGASTVDASSGDSGATSNNGVIEWPSPTGEWGNVGWVAVFDSHTAGNMLMFSKFGRTKYVGAGSSGPKIKAGKFRFTIDVDWQ